MFTSWEQAAESWKKAAEQATKGWEEQAGRWWDETLRDSRTLEGMGQFLSAMCTAKERSDRALEEHWARLRLPSAADIERVYERLGEVQAQLDRLEAALAEGATARAKAEKSADKSTDKSTDKSEPAAAKRAKTEAPRA